MKIKWNVDEIFIYILLYIYIIICYNIKEWNKKEWELKSNHSNVG